MHQVTTTVYNYSELSDEAKEFAKKQLYDILYDCFNHTVDEVIDSLKAFCEHFDFKIDWFEIDGWNNWFKISLDSYWWLYADTEGFVEDESNTKTISELTNLELVPVLIKRHSPNNFKYANKLDLFVMVDGKLTVNDKLDCPLTGLCYDMDLMDALNEFIAELYNTTQSTNIEYLISCIKSKLDKVLTDEYSYTFSDESISEYCNANDIYFTEYGVLFNN